METHTAVADDRLMSKLPRAAAAFSAAAGFLALLGWSVGSAPLRSLIPGLTAMNPATAVAFLLAGAALWLRNPEHALRPADRVMWICALLIVTIGLLQIIVCLVGAGFGIDRLLFRGTLADNRMAPNTALFFVMIGAAIFAIDGQRRGWLMAQWLAASVGAGAVLALIGYTYGATKLYGVASYIPMALNTTLTFAVLAAGILAARSDRGFVATLVSERLGGQIARRLLPAALLIPWVLGWLRMWGQRAGVYGTEFGASLMAALTVLLLTTVIYWTARRLNMTDAERITALGALRHSMEETRALYNHAPCGYHSLDSDGTFLAINDTELTWLGYARDEVVGRKTFLEILTPASQTSFAASFSRFKQEGQARDLSLEVVRKDGTAFPVLLNATAVFDEEGNYISNRSTLFDATELRRAEQTVRQLNGELERRVRERTAELADANRELLQKNQENETFVYSVSHDLRSPLVNLQGFSKELSLVCRDLREILTENELPPAIRQRGLALVDDEMGESIRFIQSGVMRLSVIIDALLRLSRAGRVEYRPQRLDMQDIVHRIIESVSGTIADRGALVTLHELPPAWGDAMAIEQVFGNLIGNALKYLDPARPAEITVGVADLDEMAETELPETYQTYYVRDNGLGIADAYQAKIFQAFQRVHAHVAPGEGMGLAIVRRIVERHGGRIWVQSVPGAGSTFFVALPSQTTRTSSRQPVLLTDADERSRGDGERTVDHIAGGR